MKTVAIMTMAFLPGTFFSALFAMPSLHWDKTDGVIGRGFTLYWALTVSLTALIFLLWGLITNWRWTVKQIDRRFKF